MSFALENKHKQSRENIEKTNNNLGKAHKPWENQKTKKQKNQKQQFSETLGWTPLSSRLHQNCVFCVFFWGGSFVCCFDVFGIP